MFSGIVETLAPVLSIQSSSDERVVTIALPRGWRPALGESISVNGVCSTVQRKTAKSFSVVYMAETLRRSTLGELRVSDRVNLERSLRLNSLIGGHLVQGHVDGVTQIRNVRAEGDARVYRFALPAKLSRYVAEKGSIALDGVSLTVAGIGRGWFSVSLLAYTMEHTTLGRKGPGDEVNVEVDMLAKYLERLTRR